MCDDKTSTTTVDYNHIPLPSLVPSIPRKSPVIRLVFNWEKATDEPMFNGSEEREPTKGCTTDEDRYCIKNRFRTSNL